MLGDGATSVPRHGRPRPGDDPDLAAAWDELEDFLESGEEGGTDSGATSTASATGDRAAHPREPLRADYATLGVPFDAPMNEVKRAYKRLMQAHHPDRFAHDPERQAAATRKAARINNAFGRIERATRAT